jgi:DNA gyrase/topoisomerase IV subunit A
MADDSTGTSAQAATGTESQADTGKATTTVAASTTSSTDTDKAQAAETALLAKKKLDKEAIQLRRERDELARKVKEMEDAKLSDTERLTKERDELKAKEATWAAERRERDQRDAALDALSSEKVGARNPNRLYRIVKDDLEFDDKGTLTNLDAVVRQAKAEFPELFGRAVGSGDGGAGSRQQPGAFDMNAEIRRRMHGG